MVFLEVCGILVQDISVQLEGLKRAGLQLEFGQLFYDSPCWATLVTEYFAVSLFKNGDQFVPALLVTILCIAFAGATTDLCSAYSYYGFKYAIKGTLKSILDKAQNKKAKKGDEIDISNSDQEVELSEQVQAQPIKTRKWLDILMGIIGIVLVVGIYFTIFYLVFAWAN